MKLLLSFGAKINARQCSEHTAVHVTAMRGHMDLLKILLAAGADPTLCSVELRTPLHTAAQVLNNDTLFIVRDMIFHCYIARCDQS